MNNTSRFYKDLSTQIDNQLMKRAIIENEEVTRETIMKKRERILKNHIENVFPIKEYVTGGKTYYYTKLNPTDRNHSKKISSISLEDVELKIIAYYLDIEISNRNTVWDILVASVADSTPATALRHKQTFKKYFSSIKNTKVSRLDENKLRECLQTMITNGITSKAFNNATSTLNKINDYCVYNHINCIDIRKKVSEFRKVKCVGKKVFAKHFKKDTDLSFTENEAVTIIKYALDNPDYHNLAIATLITTGLRAGELLALKPSDVQIEFGRLIVDKMEVTKSYEIVDRCKDDSNRIVYLNSDAKLILSKVLELRNCEESECEFLFLNHSSDDDKMHLRAIDNRIRKLQKELDLDNNDEVRSLHDCRRTYASIQYLHGVDVKTLQAQLGHSSAAQTWDYIKDIVDNSTRLSKIEKGCILN